MGRFLLIVCIAGVAAAGLYASTNMSEGTVIAVDVRNSMCEDGNRVECTKFDSKIAYVVGGQTHHVMDHDWVRGHDAAATGMLERGERVWVAYNPRTPSMGMPITVWSMGLLALVVVIPLFFAAPWLFGRPGR